jgi:6-phosphogluconolactonase
MSFLKRSLPGRLLGVAAAVVAVLAVPVIAAASTGTFPVVGHVYVNDNTAGANTIGAFDRRVDGTLTPEPGSPFAAGGVGTGASLPSQGALQSSPDGQFLIAVDAGSNQLSVLGINPDGSLRQLPGGLVASGGVMPVSITIHRDLVYVANAGAGGSNLTGFRLKRDGRLLPIPGSTVSLADGSQPGDVLFSGDGSRLAATLVGTSQIASFTVGWDGRLSAAPGSPFAAQGLGPFGSEFRPTNPSQLFVSNAHNVGAGTGTVSAFRDSYQGTLSSIASSPFPDGQTAPCWVEISHNGQFLFAVNTASGTVSSYSISFDGALTLLGSAPVTSATIKTGAEDARLSPDGRNLYVDLSAAGSVASFAVHGGTLSLLPSSPAQLPAGAAPAGIVVS